MHASYSGSKERYHKLICNHHHCWVILANCVLVNDDVLRRPPAQLAIVKPTLLDIKAIPQLAIHELEYHSEIGSVLAVEDKHQKMPSKRRAKSHRHSLVVLPHHRTIRVASRR